MAPDAPHPCGRDPRRRVALPHVLGGPQERPARSQAGAGGRDVATTTSLRSETPELAGAQGHKRPRRARDVPERAAPLLRVRCDYDELGPPQEPLTLALAMTDTFTLADALADASTPTVAHASAFPPRLVTLPATIFPVATT
jgi:hypothetical protein